MTLYRTILRSLRKSSLASASPTLNLPPNHNLLFQNPTSLIPSRPFAYSSAEEAAAERRRRKRLMRIEPPFQLIRRGPNNSRPPQDPNAPRQPNTTAALVGPRLALHNCVQSLVHAGDLDAASTIALQSVFSRIRPTVFTCNAIMASMHRAKRYQEAVALSSFFFNQSNIVPNVVSYNVLINTHRDM